MVFEQMDQNIEDLRLNRDECSTPAELPAVRVEHKIVEEKQHLAPEKPLYAL
jgi:hypothetical protein